MSGFFRRTYELQGSGGRSRILSMEGLRGIAVFLVFLVHYDAAYAPWIASDSASFAVSKILWAIGFTGVDLFFVLSGYLIYGTVISRQTNYVDFMRRRVQRIYPTFTVVFLLYIALSFAFPEQNKIPAGTAAALAFLAKNYFLLPGLFEVRPLISVAWSLSYEFFFYLTIPLVVGGLSMRRWPAERRIRFFVFAAVAYSAYCLIGPFARIRLVMFVAGMVLFERLRWSESKPWVRGYSGAIFVAALVLGGALLTRAHDLFPLPARTLANGPVYGAGLLFAAYFLWCDCALRDSSEASWLHFRPLRYLGNMSYSYYLVHGLATNTTALLLSFVVPSRSFSQTAYWLWLVPVFVATWVVSTVLFVAIEKPLSLAVKPPSGRGGAASLRSPGS